MKNKKDFFESYLFDIGNHIWYFLIANLYFILLNPLLLVLLLAVGTGAVSDVPISLIAISSLTLGPSLSALLSTMGKLVREKDVNLTSYFFKSYKNNFKQSILVNLILTLLFSIMYIDIKFFLAKKSFMIYFFFVLTIFLVLASIYAFVIISRFYLKLSDIFKAALGYPIIYFKNSITTLCILIICDLIFYSIPGLALFFIPSLFCYLLMLNHNKMLIKIENNLN